MSTLRVVYDPFPRQAAFHVTGADEAFFGGAAGPGKSLALLMEALTEALELPGSEVTLFRRTFPQLENTFIKWSLGGAPGPDQPGRFTIGEYRADKKAWILPNRSRVRFAHCEHEQSVYDYLSQQFEGMGIDELTEWSEPMYRFLLTRVRSTLPGAWPRIRTASNPIGPGFAWVRERFVLPILQGLVQPDQVWQPPADEAERAAGVKPMTRAFIPAVYTDNPILLANDPAYLGRLLQLPLRQRVALTEGKWDLPADPNSPFQLDHVLNAQQGAKGLAPPVWFCPRCDLKYIGQAIGSAACLNCKKALRPRDYLTAWDVARKRDWCVGIVLDITESPAQIVAFRRFQKVPWPEVARRIEELAARYPGRVLVDSTGVGDPLSEFLAISMEPVLFSGKSKPQMVQALQMALERGDIKGPPTGEGIEALWTELLLYQWEDDALVQDCVMALAMAAKELVSAPAGMWFQR